MEKEFTFENFPTLLIVANCKVLGNRGSPMRGRYAAIEYRDVDYRTYRALFQYTRIEDINIEDKVIKRAFCIDLTGLPDPSRYVKGSELPDWLPECLARRPLVENRIIARKGECVTRENGKYICRVARTIRAHDIPSADDFEDWQIKIPERYSAFPEDKVGKRYIRNRNYAADLHLERGWSNETSPPGDDERPH